MDIDAPVAAKAKEVSIESINVENGSIASQDLHKLLKKANSDVLRAMDTGADGDGAQPNAMQTLLDLVKNSEFDADDEWKPLHYIIKRWNQFSLHRRHLLRYASPLGRDCQMIKVYKLISLGKLIQSCQSCRC
jgi:hypothetical protein